MHVACVELFVYFLFVWGGGDILVYTTFLSLEHVSMYAEILSQRAV